MSWFWSNTQPFYSSICTLLNLASQHPLGIVPTVQMGTEAKDREATCTRSQEIKRTQECLAPSPKSNPLNYDTFDTRIGMDYVGDSFIYIYIDIFI